MWDEVNFNQIRGSVYFIDLWGHLHFLKIEIVRNYSFTQLLSSWPVLSCRRTLVSGFVSTFFFTLFFFFPCPSTPTPSKFPSLHPQISKFTKAKLSRFRSNQLSKNTMAAEKKNLFPPYLFFLKFSLYTLTLTNKNNKIKRIRSMYLYYNTSEHSK